MADKVLEPHELAERGLGEIFGAPGPTIQPLEVLGMPIVNQPQNPQTQADFVPEEDIIETLPDGRTIQKAVAGVPVPYAEAVKQGLIKEPKSQGPSETKPQPGPSETKAKAP